MRPEHEADFHLDVVIKLVYNMYGFISIHITCGTDYVILFIYRQKFKLQACNVGWQS
jgi:hypothetical protein